MATYGTAGKKRYKIRYKNVALLLAILLIIILLITRGCSALLGKKENKSNPEKDTPPLSTGDQQEGAPPADGLTNDPTSQKYYSFTTVTKTSADLGSGSLVLVNNNIKFLGSVSESELDVVREKKNNAYSVKDYTVMVRPEMMEALNNMLLDFYTVTGNDGILVNAGFRTVEYQQELYDAELAETGQETSTLVAQAGYSEHHTGLAVDLTTNFNGERKQFDGTGDYEWIMKNSYKYGIVNRYPAGKESLTLIDNEPWHFRYVGIPHATAMQQYGYCLEEYIDFIKNYTIGTKFLSVTTDDNAQYMIYYVPQSRDSDTTNIYVPVKDRNTKEPYPYEISGNNIDGWIVTFLFKEGDGVPNVIGPDEDGEPVVTSVPEADGAESGTESGTSAAEE